MPISHELIQLARIIRLKERAQKATSECEYEGYAELYSLARFCTGLSAKYWDFNPDDFEI